MAKGLNRSALIKLMPLQILLVFLGVTEIHSAGLNFDYTNLIIPWEFASKCASLGGQMLLNDTCYYTAATTLEFNSAKDLCNGDDAHVLSLQTIEEKEHLRNQGFLATPTWLSLDNVGEKLTWSDGFTSLNDSRILNISTGVDLSVGCSLYTDSVGEVTSPVCTEQHTTVCKLKHFTRCYPGWAYEFQTDKCYRIFGSSADSFLPGLGEKTVEESKEFCKKYEQGHLVSTFAGSFFIMWHSVWGFLGTDDVKAWMGIFYNAASPTSFVDDEGAILNTQTFWLKYSTQLSLYTCTYFNKTERSDIINTRLNPGENTDCDTRTMMFICETGPHSGIFPGSPVVEPSANETHHYYRSQLYQVLEDRKLPNHLVRNMTARSKISCAMNCIDMRGECLSFNFYPQGDGLPYVCELNDSMENGELISLSANSGFYYGKALYTIV